LQAALLVGGAQRSSLGLELLGGGKASSRSFVAVAAADAPELEPPEGGAAMGARRVRSRRGAGAARGARDVRSQARRGWSGKQGNVISLIPY